MPTLLGNKFTPDWLGVPPRMSTEDYDLWVRWRLLHKLEISELYFDVGLGEGYAVPDRFSKAESYFWLKETQKRADVIAVIGGAVEIIELRNQATENAIGRLLTYGVLWMDDPVIVGSLRLRLVTNRDDPDVRRLCGLYKIEFETV